MKRFNELTQEQLTQIVNSSKNLREELDSYIQDCEMCWLSEKLACIKSSLSDWSVGFYNQNYIKVRNWSMFVDGVEKSTKSYGCSNKLEKLLLRCNKLRGSNLFEYYARQLKRLFWEEELKTIIDYVEAASYELYQGSVGEKCKSYLECFFDAYTDYLYDEETDTYYKPTKLAVA